MVRTQIQVTEQQTVLLKQAASAENVSMADIIRRGIDLYLKSAVTVTNEIRIRRALAISGKFHSGKGNVSARHDDHLAEAYRK